MKKRYIIYTTLLVVIGLYSCAKDSEPYKELSDSKNGAFVYTVKARNGIQTIKTYSLDQDKYLPQDTISFNAGIGSVGLPASNIDVTFAINNKVLDSINTIREINGQKKYKPFPADAFAISSMQVTIPKGKEYSNYSTLVYNPEKFAKDTNYLIALSVIDASGYAINREVKTIIYAVSEVIIPDPVPQLLPKTNWKVIDFSSEESTGEDTNGFASLIIDGKLDTYWHSCWSECTDKQSNYPHTITVDMKTANKLSGIEFAQRQSGARGVKLLELQVSDNNVNWRTLGEFTLLNVISRQLVEFKGFETCQYFKIIVKSGYNDDGAAYVALGEVSPYILK